eukprot:581956_1
MATQGERWPLMIDPQGQAKKWVKNLEAENKILITRFGDPELLRVMERGVRTGQPVLVEDIDEILDPAIDSILMKQTFVEGGRLLIRLGDSNVDYDKEFKLYITTKLPNPHFLPEVCIKVSIINFTVTSQGLTDQLL